MPPEVVQTLVQLRHVSLQLAEHVAGDLRKKAMPAPASPTAAQA
jgi:hypothetical protein